MESTVMENRFEVCTKISVFPPKFREYVDWVVGNCKSVSFCAEVEAEESGLI